MDNSIVSIVDLPNEMLFNILNKLNNIDALYSLVDVNEKLDSIACDTKFARCIDLTTISLNDSKLNRFCLEILPKIHNKIECITIDGCLLEHIFHDKNTYSNLCKVILINIDVEMASNIFNEKCPFIINFREQISELVITIEYENHSVSMRNLLIDIYHRIFLLFSNVIYLDLNVNNYDYTLSKSLLNGLSSTICASSSITHLSIKLHNFDDCLCLLDGRLNQLQTFIVKLEFLHDQFLLRRMPLEIAHNTSILLNNTKNLDKLKCFSLYVYHLTNEFDSLVVPFIRRMSHLEKLTLSLRVYLRNSFIDGTYLNSYIFKQLPHLHTFICDIVTEYTRIDEEVMPSFDDIRRPFIERGYNIDGYINLVQGFNTKSGRCHLYSIPTDMEHIQPISHGFPGGIFMNVRSLHMRDEYDSFEYSLFTKISYSFPLLRRLTICNTIEQKEKIKNVSSLIEFPHLIELDCTYVHIDYIEQFLSDLNTRLPSLTKLYIEYEHLVTITENFTRNTTRINCEKLKSIKFDEEMTFVHSKDFYLYFPSL